MVTSRGVLERILGGASLRSAVYERYHQKAVDGKRETVLPGHPVAAGTGERRHRIALESGSVDWIHLDRQH